MSPLGAIDVCDHLQVRVGQNGGLQLEMEVDPREAPNFADKEGDWTYFEGVELTESSVRRLRELCDDFLERRL